MTDVFSPVAVEPTAIVIGDLALWTISEDYATGVYSMAYDFIQGGVTQTLTGAFTDGAWTFTATSAFTSLFTAGRVTVDLKVTRIIDSARVTLRSFTVQFFASAGERRSHAQIMVDKIESILAGRADNDVESYSIKSRQITKMSVKELTDWREYYLAELGRQADPITGRRANSNTVKVGFV
jgi:hypothetical protein